MICENGTGNNSLLANKIKQAFILTLLKVGRDMSIILPAEIFAGILETAIISIKERALLY